MENDKLDKLEAWTMKGAGATQTYKRTDIMWLIAEARKVYGRTTGTYSDVCPDCGAMLFAELGIEGAGQVAIQYCTLCEYRGDPMPIVYLEG